MKAGARSPTKAFAAFRMGGFQNFLRLAEAPPTQARWSPTLRQSLPYLPPLPGRSPIHSVSWRRPPQSSTLAPPNGHQAHTGDWLFAHGKTTTIRQKHTHTQRPLRRRTGQDTSGLERRGQSVQNTIPRPHHGRTLPGATGTTEPNRAPLPRRGAAAGPTD